MNRTLSLVAWGFLALSLCLWGGVWYFGTYIEDMENAKIAAVTDTASALSKGAAMTRLRALASDTASERARLSQIFSADIVSVANTIEDVGHVANVQIKLGSAVAEDASSQNTGGPGSRIVRFTVDGSGKFTSLMRAALLFEALPFPSSVERLDLVHEQATDKSPGQWQMHVSIKVFTAPPSSP
jgi:hypothetical protein